MHSALVRTSIPSPSSASLIAPEMSRSRGLTNTMPLHVEVLYNDYQYVGAFAVASVLALLALITLVLKSALEWRFADEIAAGHRH